MDFLFLHCLDNYFLLCTITDHAITFVVTDLCRATVKNGRSTSCETGQKISTKACSICFWSSWKHVFFIFSNCTYIVYIFPSLWFFLITGVAWFVNVSILFHESLYLFRFSLTAFLQVKNCLSPKKLDLKDARRHCGSVKWQEQFVSQYHREKKKWFHLLVPTWASLFSLRKQYICHIFTIIINISVHSYIHLIYT